MAPKAKKFYAVRKGQQAGIYLTWPDCEKQVQFLPCVNCVPWISISFRQSASYWDAFCDKRARVLDFIVMVRVGVRMDLNSSVCLSWLMGDRT